ncbi:MAG: hypothetical protein ACI87H_002503 [Gammaproteobacteria bacterium]|jgi:hypothetical protein
MTTEETAANYYEGRIRGDAEEFGNNHVASDASYPCSQCSWRRLLRQIRRTKPISQPVAEFFEIISSYLSFAVRQIMSRQANG